MQNKKHKIENKSTFDLNARGGSLEWVPLHLAAHGNHYKSVELLVDAGAKINKKNIEGKSPKDTAKGNVAIYKFLLRLEKAERLIKLNQKKNLNI